MLQIIFLEDCNIEMLHDLMIFAVVISLKSHDCMNHVNVLIFSPIFIYLHNGIFVKVLLLRLKIPY